MYPLGRRGEEGVGVEVEQVKGGAVPAHEHLVGEGECEGEGEGEDKGKGKGAW